MNFISLCFFFTGATALALEVVWSKYLSYLLGNSLYATSTVIGSYMLGLALGSWLVGRGSFKNQPPFKFFGIIQMAVGVYGALSLAIFSSTGGLLKYFYVHVHDHPSAFLALRFVVFFFLITLPVTLMGMTLPILSSGLKDKNYERHGSFLYSLNTWGAVLGSLAVAYLLIPLLGLSKTCYLLGGADFLIGLSIFVKFRAEKTLSKANSGLIITSTSISRLTIFIFCIGFLNIICEVAWYRYLANIFGGSVYAFTNVLAVYLTGLALGSYLGGKEQYKKVGSIENFLAQILIGLASVCILTLYTYNYIPYLYLKVFNLLDGNHSVLGILGSQLFISSLIILPVTLFMGALLPVLLRYAREKEGIAESRQGIGFVYAYLTFGNVAGSLAAGFIIVPYLGFFTSLRAFAILMAILGFGLNYRVRKEEEKGPGKIFWHILVVTVIAVSLPPLDLKMLNQGFFNLVASPSMVKASKEASEKTSLVFYDEGINVSVAVLGNEFGDGGLGLRVSSKGEAHTSPQGRRHLLLLGQLPMLFHDYPKDVAVIGFGGGMTAHSVLSHTSVKTMDVMEFEPGVIKAASYFDLINEKPLEDPRTKLLVEDGRIHLTYTDKKYDVITTDPISPWVAGSANLYSVDFYKLARERLNNRGLVCQWVQLGDFSEESFKVMLNSMRKVFPQVNIFIYADDAILIASDHVLHKNWSALAARFSQPEVKKDFSENEIESMQEVLNYFYADTKAVDKYLGPFAQTSNDDNVYLEYTLPFELYLKKGNLGRQIATQFISGRHERLQKLAIGAPKKELINMEFTHFLDEFAGVPEEVLADVLTDPQLASEKKSLTQNFKRQPDLIQKAKNYELLWLALRQAAANKNEKEQIRILQEIRESAFSQGYINATLQLIYIHIQREEYILAEALIAETKKRSPALKEVYELELKLLGKQGDRYGQMQVAEQAMKYIPNLVFSRESKF